MKKTQARSDKLREPSGHFSQAIAIPAQGRIVFILGIPSRRADGTIAGVGDNPQGAPRVLRRPGARLDHGRGDQDGAPRLPLEINAIAVLAS